MNEKTVQLEAILFFKGEPITAKKLAELLEISKSDVVECANELKTALESRGIRLMEKDGAYLLATAPEHAKLIDRLKRDELTKEIGKAGIETLAIVLYKGPVSRADIDYIRGVNSSYILRNLQVRGLIERVTDAENQRAYYYRPTFDLLAHLGVASVSELPEYEAVAAELAQFAEANEEAKEEEQKTEA